LVFHFTHVHVRCSKSGSPRDGNSKNVFRGLLEVIGEVNSYPVVEESQIQSDFSFGGHCGLQQRVRNGTVVALRLREGGHRATQVRSSAKRVSQVGVVGTKVRSSNLRP